MDVDKHSVSGINIEIECEDDGSNENEDSDMSLSSNGPNTFEIVANISVTEEASSPLTEEQADDEAESSSTDDETDTVAANKKNPPVVLNSTLTPSLTGLQMFQPTLDGPSTSAAAVEATASAVATVMQTLMAEQAARDASGLGDPDPSRLNRYLGDESTDDERSNHSTAGSDSMLNTFFNLDSESDADSAHVSLRVNTNESGESPTHYRLVMTQSRREDIGTLRGFDEVNVLPAREPNPMEVETPTRAISPYSDESNPENPNLDTNEQSMDTDDLNNENPNGNRILNGRPIVAPESSPESNDEGAEEAAESPQIEAEGMDEGEAQLDVSTDDESSFDEEDEDSDNNIRGGYMPENLGFFAQPGPAAQGSPAVRHGMGAQYDRARSGPANLEPRTWFVSNPRVRMALRNVMLEARRENEGPGRYLGRGNILQNLRRMLFIGSHPNRAGLSIDASSSDNESQDASQPEAVENDEPANNNEEAGPPEEMLISFDRNLPAEHSYMGNNMNRVSGVEYLEPGQSYRLMLFMHEHILFPGEILPFMIHSYVIDRLDDQTGLLFGICFPEIRGPEDENLMYGVTCHVYERGSNQSGQSLFKSKALQRFVIETSAVTGVLQPIANSYAKAYGNVKILPELYLVDPLKRMDHMGSMSRYRDMPSALSTFRRFQLTSTPLPFYAYDQYNIDRVIEKARNVLAGQKLDNMPKDPIKLSFWLMRNLHLSDDLITKAFVTDSVNKRMLLIETSFVEVAHFACRFCAKKIANCSELFAMSKHGVQTQYCNSAGYIHQTNTVYKLCKNAVSFSGNPSSEFSWFPGYEWQIIVCKRCSHHIGWKFKAVEADLEPKIFFAITSSSVRITTSVSETSERIPLSRMILSYVATLMDTE